MTTKELIEKKIKEDGIGMCKLLNRGFFGNTYDERIVYSLEELYRLSKEGFRLDENLALFMFNAFL